MSGPGKFYFTGLNARFLNLGLLNRCFMEMVKMSPLQSYCVLKWCPIIPRLQ